MEASPNHVRQRDGQTDGPLSFAQQRLWFLDQLEPSALYNICWAMRLSGPLDLAALEQTFAEILRRHGALRTRFRSIDGTPVQVVDEPWQFDVPLIDLSELSQSVREEHVQNHANDEARRLFNLATGPLWRVQLLRLQGDEHVLISTMHHIVTDGWSKGVFFRELEELYGAYCAGRPSPLPDLTRQYIDHARWQREWLQGDELAKQTAYWKNTLAGSPALMALPTDRRRPSVQRFRGNRELLELPIELTQALKALGRSARATLFMTLLAAFQALLARYTGEDDIVVGSPIANRTHVETEGLIGFFANTLVLRTDITGNPPVRELLRRVRDVALQAYCHQEMPFEKLVEELRPERSLSHTPLFHVMFVLQNAPRRVPALPGLTLTPIAVDTTTAKFDLTLSMTEEQGGLRGMLDYDSDLFDPATIRRMAEHFRCLLEGSVADPDQRISDLPLIGAAERQRLLVEWNATDTEYPADRCVHDLFEAQANRTPANVAIVCDDREVTYQELNRRANQLAHHLVSLGVGADSRVALCVERSTEMVIGLLGVLKAGGAYVPLDPTYPSERLAYMLQDAEAAVLITQESLLARLPPNRASVICLDRDAPALMERSAANPSNRTAPEHLAYVIYTSGSTGRPKGVGMPHRPLVNLLAWQLRRSAHGAGRTLQFTSLSFDVAFQEIFSTWCAGGTLVLVPEDTRRDPALLAGFIADRRIERLFLPFVALQQLAEWAGREVGRTYCLREIITAGEQLRVTPEIVEWFRTLGDCTLENQYGPTESHVVTAFTLTGLPGDWPLLPPIGRGIANARLYVLDREGQPSPIGVPGELHIGGACLARGYLNQPQMTAERFIPDRFAPEGQARIYRTGDLARYRSDGEIEFWGRIDDQVKIRGFRVEPGEIEAVLGTHASVAQVVVTAIEQTRGNPQLIAYIVPLPGTTPAVGDLRAFARTKLPEYMVPAAVIVLEALPLTPSGKVNRRALPPPERADLAPASAFVAPRTPTEERLARVWTTVLGIDRIGVHDNFFDVGGHSLLAVKLFAALENVFGRKLRLSTLFEGPTIARLAALLEESDGARRSLVAIRREGTRPPFFCVHAVDGEVLYFESLAHYLGSDQPFYGLQPIELEAAAAAIPVATLAADYANEIAQVHPKGPVLLGGYSSGGNVAFEIARRLAAEGRHVALVALIDTHAAYTSRTAVRERILKFTEEFRLKPEERLRFIRDLQAARRYVPQPYAGRVDLFRAERFAVADPDLGWRAYALGGVHVHLVPGDHMSCIHEPHVRHLAERLRSVIDSRVNAVAGLY